MKRALAASIACSLGLAALAGCSDDEVAPQGPVDTVRVAFQDGVSPSASYRGTADAVLKDDPNPATANTNYGAASSDTLGSVLLSTEYFERRFIIRMDLSSITDCSQVVSARLLIHVVPPAPNSLTLEAHALNMPTRQWTEGFGGTASGVSWATIDGAIPWTEPGGDFLTTVIDEHTVSTDSVVTFALSPALVMEWIQKPLLNDGVVIKTTDVTRSSHTTVFQREYGNAIRRPRLEIAYLPGG